MLEAMQQTDTMSLADNDLFKLSTALKNRSTQEVSSVLNTPYGVYVNYIVL